MTVGELREALAGLPGHLPVVLNNDVLGDYVDLENPRMIGLYGDFVVLDSGEVVR
jgi:hypothetical protein